MNDIATGCLKIIFTKIFVIVQMSNILRNEKYYFSDNKIFESIGQILPSSARHENKSVRFRRQFEWFLGSSNYGVRESHEIIYTIEDSLSFR